MRSTCINTCGRSRSSSSSAAVPARRTFVAGSCVTEGEPAYDIQPGDHEVGRRIEQDHRAGIGLACVSLSAPLGIESLPRAEAGALIDAWHRGALDLPDHFAAWASIPTEEPDLSGLAELLSGPFAGVQLPATALASPSGWYAAGEVLRVAELAGKPVFVHPGPASADGCGAVVVGARRRVRRAAAGRLVGVARLRRTLAVPAAALVFAAGAGLAPVHHERLTARGGQFGQVDPDVFVDTSSYGAQGLDALVRALGIDVLVLGSDRPYAEPLDVAPRRRRDAGGPRGQPAPGARWEPGPDSRPRPP